MKLFRETKNIGAQVLAGKTRVALHSLTKSVGAVMALSRRVARMEREGKPRPSPFVFMFGSFDMFEEVTVLPEIEAGHLSRADMVDVVAALRSWESDGTWGRPP